MNAELVFQAIQAMAVLVGVGFAVYELRRYRRDRNREAAMELLHTFQTAEFAKALVLVYRLPDGLSRREIEGRLGDDLHLVYAMTTTWESIGVLVWRGEVAMDLVDDFFSGPIVVSWRKLQGYFFDERRETGRETIGEWFQWLAERFAEREGTTRPVPAHVAFRDWRPR
jgi:hypothetical protein